MGVRLGGESRSAAGRQCRIGFTEIQEPSRVTRSKLRSDEQAAVYGVDNDWNCNTMKDQYSQGLPPVGSALTAAANVQSSSGRCVGAAPGIGWRYVDAIRDGPEVRETNLQSSIGLALKLMKLLLSQERPGNISRSGLSRCRKFRVFRSCKIGHGRVSTRPSGEGAGGRLAVSRVTVWARLQIPPTHRTKSSDSKCKRSVQLSKKEEKGRGERKGEEQESERLWRLETAVRASQGSGCCC